MIALLLSVCFAAPVQRYAVVVGTNQGAQGDEPLRFADRDAERVGHVLADLGDVPGENIVTLRNVDADRVRGALKALADRIERRSGDAEALLFFYYSGHADADAMRLRDSTLPFDDLIADLQAMPVDVRVLVVDACQSGELTRLKGAQPAEPFDIVTDDRLDSEGLAVITSSSLGEDSQESDRLQGGIFTHHFVAGLMGAADASSDGRVTLSEAHSYARDATIRSTSAARFVQHPSFSTELRGGTDLVLTRVDDPGNASALEFADPGVWLVFDNQTGGLVAEADLAQRGRLVVPRGNYMVRVRQPQGIREQSISVGTGESLELYAADMTPVSPGRTVRKGIDEKRRSATSVVAGTGFVGATSADIASGAGGHVGLSVDLEALTLGARVVGAYHRSTNAQLTLRQVRVGLEASGMRKADVGLFSLGLGLRGGLDVTRQAFETEGVAPVRSGLSGRVGPVTSIDLRIGAKQSLSLVGASDIQLYRLFDSIELTDRMASQVVPYVGLEFSRYVR